MVVLFCRFVMLLIIIVLYSRFVMSFELFFWTFVGARGVMVIVVGNGHGDTSLLDETDCISHSTNTLGKGMNPVILPPAMGK